LGYSCSVKFIQILQDLGLQLDHKILKGACYGSNLPLIEYLLDSGIMPSTKLLEEMLNRIKTSVLTIFLKHQIIFSNVRPPISNKNLQTFIELLDGSDLDKNIFIQYLVNKIHE